MKTGRLIAVLLCSIALLGLVASPVLAQEKAKKATTQRLAGDVGNVNEEKNTITIVTRDAKIITISIPQKAKLSIAKPGKLVDVPLGAEIQAVVDDGGNAATVVIIPRGGEE